MYCICEEYIDESHLGHERAAPNQETEVELKAAQEVLEAHERRQPERVREALLEPMPGALVSAHGAEGDCERVDLGEPAEQAREEGARELRREQAQRERRLDQVRADDHLACALLERIVASGTGTAMRVQLGVLGGRLLLRAPA